MQTNYSLEEMEEQCFENPDLIDEFDSWMIEKLVKDEMSIRMAAAEREDRGVQAIPTRKRLSSFEVIRRLADWGDELV